MRVNRHRLGGARFERKQAAEENTRWNSYTIHDRDAAASRIQAVHSGYVQGRLRLMAAGLVAPHPIAVETWLEAESRRYARHCGNQSKYTPHQGTRECARRV